MNLTYARKMREQFMSDKVRFSGFNRMTDGTIADFKGDLKNSYENEEFTCTLDIPYDEIEADVLAAGCGGIQMVTTCTGGRSSREDCEDL